MKPLARALPMLALWIASVVLSCSMTSAEEPMSLTQRRASRFSDACTVRDKPLVHSTQFLPRDTSQPVAAQMEQVLDDLLQAVKLHPEDGDEEGFGDLFKLNLYVSDESAVKEAAQVLRSRFVQHRRPAVSWVVTQLTDSKAKVAADAVVITKRSPAQVERSREAGSTGPARVAILPVGPRVYISGQAEKGDGSLADATRQTMAGLVKTLEHLGLSRRDVVQLKAFLTPMKDASVAVKEMIAAFPGETPPPMVLVEWESSLPIEIELIAASPATKETQKAEPLEFITPPWMKASPVFCRVVRVNHPATIYISDRYGETDKRDSAEEVRDLYGSLRRIVETSGSDLQHLAKATYYVSTDEVSSQLNTVRPEFYDPERPPAASKAKVRGTGRTGRTITLDMIAVPKGP
ncbi:MAG: RidA family protein [Candidatus Saccharimonas sp.]|nr:RidA family protein [Planctomycetaceae bacterium]